MTLQEASDKLTELKMREQRAFEAMVPVAKAAINVLKDHKMNATAAELDACIYAIEGIRAELTELITSDPKAFMEVMLRSFERQR